MTQKKKPEKPEIIPDGATEIPEWPKGREWYQTHNRTRVEKFIAGLPDEYLKEAMTRLANYHFPPASALESQNRLAYFLEDNMAQVICGRILELIGYERKNNSRIGELTEIRARCFEVIWAYQRYLADIDYLIHKHKERGGRLTGEKDSLKTMIATVMADKALRAWKEHRNNHIGNKILKELSETEFPKTTKETRERTRHRTQDGNAGKKDTAV